MDIVALFYDLDKFAVGFEPGSGGTCWPTAGRTGTARAGCT